MTAILALRPRVVGYVSCDPGTLARDVAVAQDLGWRLTALRAFDAFPMTQHVECVSTLQPADIADPP
jgi:tRNA/tmRNA/rRNA uracil-C5-methylase (TrmA/RlmC/RlmD family)